jgi:hypothetical protein
MAICPRQRQQSPLLKDHNGFSIMEQNNAKSVLSSGSSG